MKMKKSITSLGKAIGLDAIIGCIITVVLIAGVILGIFRMKKHYEWSSLISDSKGDYKYTAYNENYIKGVEDEVSGLYKSARVLNGYSDIDNLSLENLSSQSIMIYGWDKNNSEKLNTAINNILEEVNVLKNQTSFTAKEKKVILESLGMIRYFCENQQVINKVRLEMKLTGQITKSSSNLNVEIIGDGGREYLENYGNQLVELKNVFQ